MKASYLFPLVVIALLVAACVEPPAPTPASVPTAAAPVAASTVAPAAANTVAPAPAAATAAGSAAASPSPVPATPAAAVTPAAVPAGWQMYSNPAGFAIAYPAAWTAQAQPDSNSGNIHTQALKGPEGEVDLSWGVGFGGACPPGYATVKVAQGYLQACYTKKTDGSESWTQMSQMLPGSGFQGQAATSSAQPTSRDLVLQILSTLTFAPVPGATPVPPPAMYTDPFAYCAAVGTIDAPDARYDGPQTPGSVLPVPAGSGTPSPLPAGSVYWRCMDGNVYACYVGANIPCWAKANTSTTPSEGMQNWCKDHPNDSAIPAVATGHETIYAWSCQNGVPVKGRQMLQVDAQGYPVEYWKLVPNPAPGTTAPQATTAPVGSAAPNASAAPTASAPSAATAAAPSLQPLTPAECQAVAAAMGKTLGAPITTGQAEISDWTTGQTGMGCQATATGTGTQFKDPSTVIKALDGMLTSMGWTEDQNFQAGGPTGMGDGYRKDGQLCLTSAMWQPGPAVTCPSDQPISACNVPPEQQVYTVTVNCAQASATAPATAAATSAAPAPGAPAGAATPAAGMANPASVNCTKQGGTLSIQTNGEGGQYGVCLFEDNRQCEEWALMRGDCPVGGVKVTGYVTPAAQYCAITGGTYKITGNSNTPQETGTCTLKDGRVCDATAYWNGGC